MEHLKIEATDRSPEIDFDFDNNKFLVKGELYPEDVTAFYGPVIEKLEQHLEEASGSSVEFTFELIYFNSSSAKILMHLFDTLDEAADDGATVTINWVYDEEDDTMEELGQEFAEDLEHAKFVMKKLES